MPQQTTTHRLTRRLDEALAYAAEKHRLQLRKGGGIPYLGHLLAVAAYVIEADGTETEAIAALLHDTAEDQGGEPILADIAEKFGDDVASIVRECSDTVVVPKPPWRERKERYIMHLSGASDSAVLVSVADKLNNAHAILRDYRMHGADLWARFSVSDPRQHLWYYTSLLEVYQERFPNSWLVTELREVLDTLEREVVASA